MKFSGSIEHFAAKKQKFQLETPHPTYHLTVPTTKKHPPYLSTRINSTFSEFFRFQKNTHRIHPLVYYRFMLFCQVLGKNHCYAMILILAKKNRSSRRFFVRFFQKCCKLTLVVFKHRICHTKKRTCVPQAHF